MRTALDKSRHSKGNLWTFSEEANQTKNNLHSEANALNPIVGSHNRAICEKYHVLNLINFNVFIKRIFVYKLIALHSSDGKYI